MKRVYRSGRNRAQFSQAIESLESRLLLSATRYVDLNSLGPAHDGTSWDSAYVDLQQALTAATAGDQIHVADGTYKPTAGTDRTISFALKTGVSVMGGFAGSGAPDPNSRDVGANVTVLSGDIGTFGTNTDNSYHVLVGSATTGTALLDGFTITAGYANGSSSPTNSGGGMYNSAGTPTVTNCTFSGNSANGTNGYGGGMYNSSSSPALTNCIIWSNGSSLIYNTYSSTPVITYSDIQGGWTGTANINVDPLFVRNPSPGADAKWGTADDDYGDLRLRLASPCIDAASNAAVPAGITTDLAGNPRFIDVPGVRDPGAIVDMGAYEYTLPLAASTGTFLFSAARPSVRFGFNGDLDPSSLAAADLTLVNLTTGQSIDCATSSAVSYDSSTRSATWAFSILLPDGIYHATLPAASVNDAGGNPLASDFSFEFFALAGDANHDRTVDISDLGILATNWQGSAKTFAQGDFNYDGIVDISDLGILATSWQKTLPAPSPAIGAGMRFTSNPIVATNATPVRRLARASLASDLIL